uniref:Uncharacterized protein n=1 Tax=Arundo donax TaxID=35708 RepID=A0A0A9DF65_ARUDO
MEYHQQHWLQWLHELSRINNANELIAQNENTMPAIQDQSFRKLVKRQLLQ